MLDPALEQLHRARVAWRADASSWRSWPETTAFALLAVPMALLLLFAPAEPWGHPTAVAAALFAFVILTQVRFDIGATTMSPTLLGAVLLWTVVPPAWLLPVTGATFTVGRLIERTRRGDEESIARGLLCACDAWPYAGPALVLTLVSSSGRAIDSLEVLTVAVVACTVVDLFYCLIQPRLSCGSVTKAQVRMTGLGAAIDLALAPVAIAAVMAAPDPVVAPLLFLPPAVLLQRLALDRSQRIGTAVELSDAYRGTALLLADVLEVDDAYTGGEHTTGVVQLAKDVGCRMGLSSGAMRELELAALLHDIGKLRVPKSIINKPGRLTDAEWAIIRQHPADGQEMLDRVGGLLTEVGIIVRHHHERWDGGGYPDGIAGEEIPLASRIITVCDSYSAMTTTRSYRTAMSRDEALDELERCADAQFDRRVVETLSELEHDEAQDRAFENASRRIPTGLRRVA